MSRRARSSRKERRLVRRTLTTWIKVLKDATLNNMTNNVFLINFDSVNSVAITSGIYDPVARKLYV